MSKVLGIDLGTSISKMATVLDGEPKCLENREGSVLTPSVVALAKNGERLVGVLAKRQAITNSEGTVSSAKRFIGRRYADPEIQKELKKLPYKTRERKDGGIEAKMGEKWYSPIQIASMILQKLKLDAEERIGEKVESAVITCPANFDDSQRKATETAGEVAGLKVLRIINEPTAAALAYGLGRKKAEKVVVYDFGGGTFDVSVLNVSPDTVEVIATGGESHLGGNDFDQKIIDWIVESFKKDNGIDLLKDSLALQRLKEVSENVKKELSSAMETEINLPFISSDASGPKHLYYKLTRAQLNNMSRDLVERAIDRVDKTLKEAKLTKEEIDEIILVGGTTLIPAVKDSVKEYFGKNPNKAINPEEVVATGAAIEAEILRAQKEGDTPEGDIKSVLLLDVLPLSLGLETLGKVSTVMISKNTTIPTAKTQIFSTAADNQPSVEINILQGERPMASDNRSLGKFILTGILPAPRGLPQVEVTFDIDANGILSVSAKDKATNLSQSIKVEGSIGLSKEEVEKMKKEAELHVEEDKKKKELIEAKNIADNLIYTSEKTLKELGDKVSSEIKSGIEGKIKELKEVKDGTSMEEIKNKSSDLSQELQKIGAEAYKKAAEEAKKKQPQAENVEEASTSEKEEPAKAEESSTSKKEEPAKAEEGDNKEKEEKK